MTRKQKRFSLIISGLGVLGLAVGLVLYALRDNIVFFYVPLDVLDKHVPVDTRFRLGGLVKEGSVDKRPDGETCFVVTDFSHEIAACFKGALPDLFREGQGVVAEGRLNAERLFVADSVLAKHDENYMPAEVAEALKKSGKWQGVEQGEGAVK